MGGELVVAMYTVLLGDEWDTKLPNTLKRRILTYNYTIPQRFEYDLDIVQKQVKKKNLFSLIRTEKFDWFVFSLGIVCLLWY